MISQVPTRTGARVTFSVASKTPVSVVADFNEWDPHKHPLRSGKGGIRSATVNLPGGSYAFRYLAQGGLFFDDPDADAIEANPHGGTQGVVEVPMPAAPSRRAKKSAKVAKKEKAATAPESPKPRRRAGMRRDDDKAPEVAADS